MELKLLQIEQYAKNQYISHFTDSDISELEDQLAVTAARVQSTESEVRFNYYSSLVDVLVKQ